MRDRISRRSSEFAVVLVLALGFGLVGIDRFLITTMFPTIAQELRLDYGDIGVITGVLALAWGVAALFIGNLADRIGRRRVLVASLVIFSLLIGASGLATGLMGLVLVRVLMGFADGAFTPASIASTIEASAPQRAGRNVGFQQTMLPLFGLGLSPLIVAELLHVVDWRWVFSVFTIPGLALAALTWRILPPDPPRAAALPSDAAPGEGEARTSYWREVLSHRNVVLAAIMMLCWLTCLITSSAFMPSYLVDHMKLSQVEMGRVMSAIGLGAMAGTFVLPALSDRIGRKPIMILCALGATGSLIMLSITEPDPWFIFAWLFCVHFFNNAAITLTVGPICSDSVRPGLIATASGLVIGVGEIVGGGLAPIAAGLIAQRLGIQHLLVLPIAATAVGFLLGLLLKQVRHNQNISGVQA